MRDIVIARDGGCLLLVVFDFSGCNGYAKEGQLILQGDHLIMRANSATLSGHAAHYVPLPGTSRLEIAQGTP